ncbi:hypothetical protein OU5_P0296 (plasmid) [Pseudomonas mandelii JR-1]|uniref:Uncharacterized protein n=1 Tax=Pseudomonas mandelii JR-1 TaxID=1147786 RepID=A0A024EMD5_9PSED|nr:hypothetical protein OU5_P0296 [Pseudomonas mandelii JR-1]
MLVIFDVNDRSGRMQTAGQIERKWVVTSVQLPIGQSLKT